MHVFTWDIIIYIHDLQERLIKTSNFIISVDKTGVNELMLLVFSSRRSQQNILLMTCCNLYHAMIARGTIISLQVQ